MLKTILKYGAIAGVLVAIPTFAIPVTFKSVSPTTGMVIGFTSMLVALSFVFMGVKHQRDTAGGGIIAFWPASGSASPSASLPASSMCWPGKQR